jgi:hypothetical protein
MMFTYTFDPNWEDLLLAVKKLAELAKAGEISVRSIVTVETGNEDLARILDFMMPTDHTKSLSFEPVLMSTSDVRNMWTVQGAAELEESIVPTTGQIFAAGVEVKKERIANKVEKATGAVRSCAQCGAKFEPKRKDQILCGKVECKRAQQRSYAAKAKEVGELEEEPEIEQVEVEVNGVEHDASPFLIAPYNLSERA